MFLYTQPDKMSESQTGFIHKAEEKKNRSAKTEEREVCF